MKKIFTLLLSLFVFVAIGQVQVTFSVDMTGQTISTDGVHIAGNFNGWTTDANQLVDQGSNIYAVTIDLKPGTDYEYKFLNGNLWGTEEAAPVTCTIGGNNRIFTAPTSDVTLPVTPFNSCPSAVETQNVKFSVDMTGQTVSADGIHVAGNFNAWNPGGTMMSDVGNNIFEVTVPVFSSIEVLQYKFINGNAWGSEETAGDGCANSDSNRPFVLKDAGSSVDLPVATFGGCANPLPTKTIVFSVDLAGATVSGDGVHVAGSFQGWDPAGTMMTELSDNVFQVEVEVLNSLSYIEYKYLNGNAWGTDEVVPVSCSYNNNRFHIMDLADEGPILLDRFEIGTCNGISVSTQDLDETPVFSIFPTVVNGEFFITFSNAMNVDGNLAVYSLSGEVVHQEVLAKNIANAKKSLNVTDWPSGMYVVTVRTQQAQFSQKVIVK